MVPAVNPALGDAGWLELAGEGWLRTYLQTGGR
jgi:hypothetical protein